jgi:photosystem II stability/assembly factor-like uncharacterized protein
LLSRFSVIVILIINISLIKILPQSSWQPLGLSGNRIYTLVQDSSGNIYAGMGQGIAKIKPDNTIQNLPTTSNFFEIQKMIFCPATNLLIASQDLGLIRSKDGGDSWEIIPNLSISYGLFFLAINSTGTCFASNISTGILRSTDGGITWDSVSNINGGFAGLFISKAGNIFAATTSGLIRSKNNGQTWDTLHSFLYFPYQFGMNPVTGTLFIGVDDISNTSSRALTFRSTDEGDTWKLVDTTGTNIDAIYGAPNGYMYAGKGEVYCSINDGLTWSKFGTGLPTNNTMQIEALVERNGVLYAGDRVWGLYSISTTPTGIRNEQQSDFSFRLNQNYPNPFNPNTVISYSLPSASNVKLIVYNALGQTIKVLGDEFKKAGNYSFNFNASDIPSGIYFYKLDAGQFSQIKKMILLK